MAKIECELHGDFNNILQSLHDAVMRGSSSATIEESSDFSTSVSRCSIRAYERYSYSGRGRVSLNIVLFQSENRIFLSAVSTGGSQAMFFKVNTLGENNFLDSIKPAVNMFL